ncbi:hypothetical protein [Bartonella acomydis]|uniref:Uncharacterized protein n=1 Tax=Bartonella acomydis TaxID=686234 RepID=A0ABP9N1U8_9HYPH
MKQVILAAALFSFFSSALTVNASSVGGSSEVVDSIAKHENYAGIEGFGQQAIDLLARIVIPVRKNPSLYESPYHQDRFQIRERDYGFAADLGFKKRCKDLEGLYDGQKRMECSLK